MVNNGKLSRFQRMTFVGHPRLARRFSPIGCASEFFDISHSSSHLYNDRWGAATEKIPRAEKKSHLPGELHNRTEPVARVLSSRSALAKRQSSAVRGKKTKTGTGDGLGFWACDTTPEAASQAPANALMRVPQNELPKFAHGPTELRRRLTRLPSFPNRVSAATSVSSETQAPLSTLQSSRNPATRTQPVAGKVVRF
jgi:hypothetical protein